MQFSFHFLKKKKKGEKVEDEKVQKEKSHVVKKTTKKRGKKENCGKKERKNQVFGMGYIHSLCSFFVNSFPI